MIESSGLPGLLDLVLHQTTEINEAAATAEHSERPAWRAVRRDADQARLAGLVALAVQRGRLEVDEADVEPFVDACRLPLERAVVIERSLVRAHDRLVAVGVRPIVLKGVAVAHIDYPTSAIRSFADVDLLVHPDHMDRAIETLLDAGGRRDLPPRTRTWDRTFAKDVPITDQFGTELDIHRTLDRGPFGRWIDLDSLHRSAVPFRLGGRTMLALGPSERVMHAAYALTITESDPRLAHAVDLVLAARSVPTPGVVSDLAERWRAGSILADAISVATQMTGYAPVAKDGRLLLAPPPHPAETAARRRYRRGGATNAAELLAVTQSLPPARWPGYLRALAFPSRAYRRARRNAGRPREVTAAIEEARRRLRRRLHELDQNRQE